MTISVIYPVTFHPIILEYELFLEYFILFLDNKLLFLERKNLYNFF
jgi:hypothetical protein